MLTILFAIVLMLLIQSPIVVLFIDQKKQRQYGEQLYNKTEPDNDRFERPDKLWLLTLNGILTSGLLFLFFLSLIFVITHILFQQVYLPKFIGYYAFTWVVIIAMLFFSFKEHKNDYVFMGADRLEYKKGSKLYSISRDQLRIVEKKLHFLLYSGSEKKVQINKHMIRGFIGGDILLKRFRELI